MAALIYRTWASYRCVYAKNTFGSTGNGASNIVYPYGIYASPPSSKLFRLPLDATFYGQRQPLAFLSENPPIEGNFFFGYYPSLGGLIPSKEWEYIKGKTVITERNTSFQITDDAQFNTMGQTTPPGEGYLYVNSIEGFTEF
jgi:hypothetical protein